MPSRGQQGSSMKRSLAQQAWHSAAGSRQGVRQMRQLGGSTISTAMRASRTAAEPAICRAGPSAAAISCIGDPSSCWIEPRTSLCAPPSGDPMRLTIEDALRLKEVLARAGVGEIMPRFRRLGAGAIREKTSALDLVTDADEAGERAIRAEVEALWPDAVFVGEESTAHDESLLARIGDAELAFIVDPIDGTTNFANGVPLFGTIAAFAVRGETAMAVIHDP